MIRQGSNYNNFLGYKLLSVVAACFLMLFSGLTLSGQAIEDNYGNLTFNYSLEFPMKAESFLSHQDIHFNLIEEVEDSSAKSRGYNFPAAYSLLCPGLGHYLIDDLPTEKPFYLVTIAGFGTLGSALFFQVKSSNAYTDYLGSNNFDLAEPFFNEAKKHQKTANLLYAASATIWAADFVWVYVRQNKKVEKLGILIGPNSMGLSYTF